MVEKDKFYNIFQQLETKQKTAVLICWALAFCIAVCVVGVIFYALSPKPIYYINGATGLASPIVDYSPIAEEYAKMFVSNITNFTGENAEKIFDSAKRLCSPAFLSKIRPVLANEVASATKSRMNSMGAIMKTEVKTLSVNSFQVDVHVYRTIWIGQEKIKDKTYLYKVVVKKASPTATNPTGLVIDNVEITESGLY
ncbi:MAG TPA: hypothetical protein P5150_07690 [Candidatus Ratteibacteria bacterium]|nr:hypothetical protein [Candidatus Ratteibacteria bacterium]